MTVATPGQHRYDEPQLLAEAVVALPAPLLLCTDIDGTLSVIADTPGQARLAAGADDALRALARVGIDVAVVSGRPIADLVRQFQLPRTLHLVGSHGVEFDQSSPRTEHESELLDRVDLILADVAGRHQGAVVERKPFGAALHVRQSPPAAGALALTEAEAAIAAIDGVYALPGHQVYEAVVRQMTKVDAIEELRRQLDPASVVFIGDDHSDEMVFVSFAEADGDARDRTLGVKVGADQSVAAHRLRTPDDVVAFLQALVRLLAD